MTALEILQQNLRNLRLRMGLTQEKAAEKIGVAYRHFQAIEVEKREGLQLATVERIAKGLKVEIWQLLQAGHFPPPGKTRGNSGRIER
ncbi:MAG: helix-turn-helix transcriptional regulator [Opitutaceae bacterium]|nr:helix-turn-helix transcriptional regulator [Opitutaceae bacterium]